VAKTDQQLAQEELARQGIDYKYGGDTIMGAFIPTRRQVIRPEQNQFIGYDDRGRAMIQTIPAQYGEAETDFSYTPVVRGAKAAGSFLRDVFFGDANEQAQAVRGAYSALRGIGEAVPQMVTEQARAAASGGRYYDPESNRIVEFDPMVVMGGGGAPSGSLASGFGRSRSALDTSNAARLRRAEQQGFGDVLYHASAPENPIDEFRPKYSDGLTFLTTDREFANNWLGKGGSRVDIHGDDELSKLYKQERQNVWDKYESQYGNWENWPKSVSDAYNKESSDLYRQYSSTGYSIYPVRTNVQNTFDPSKDTDVLDALMRFKGVDPDSNTLNSGMTNRQAYQSGNYILYENPEVVGFLKDQGFDSMRLAEYYDEPMSTIAIFDPKNIRSVNAEFDPEQRESANILYSGGGRTGTGVAAGSAIDETLSVAGSRLPPLENAQRTQLGASTLPSYEKAAGVLGSEGRALDFGAGRGQGAQAIGFDTFEPYPREGFSPTYTTAADIPDQSYDRLTSLNVLNVMPRDVRDQAVADIGRVLRPGGRAVVTTRGRDVLNAQGRLGDEPMSIITTADTYQKGFTQPELREYIQGQLGDEFTISNLPEKIGQAGVLIERTGGGTTLRSGSRAGTGVAAGSAIRETFRIGDEGFDPRFDSRAKEQQRILDTELRYESSPIVRPYVSIYDLEGKPFALTMADRTKAGSRLLGVEGVDYDIPVDLQGGQDYMFANPLGREGQVWAQDKGATSMYLNSFMGLGGQPIADEILMLPYRMAPSGGDFATMTAETMLTHARNNMTRRSKAKVDRALRGIYPEWKGIDNPESITQIAMMKGDPRKQILQVMDRDFRNEGGIGIGQARLAVTDRLQYNAPDYTLQNVGAADPYLGRFEQSGHRTYSQGLAGRPIGTLVETDINAMELLPDFVRGRGFGSVDELLAADPEILAREYYTMRRGLRGGTITEDMLRDIERRRSQ